MTYGKLYFVSDGDSRVRAADGWRHRFSHADRLPVTASGPEKRQRGRDFELVLHGMLAEAELEPRTSFRPPGEEIDGSFFHRGRVLLLEAKWTKDPLPASSIYQFRGKVEGKLVGTIGVFISMNGFSADAVDALVAGKLINTILFDGDDIRAIATDQIDIETALDRKLRAAAEGGTPYLPLRDQVTGQPIADKIWKHKPPRAKVVLVEGRFDALLVHALADELGPPDYQLEVVPAGGVLNLASMANLMRTAGNGTSVVIIADGDGDPNAIRQVIEKGLSGPASGAASPAILIFEPAFEQALGILEGFAERRRRVLKLDSQLLRNKIRQANVFAIAERDPEVNRLLTELGLTTRD